MEKLIKYSGFALIMGGLSFIITNGLISPFVDFKAPFRELLVSSIFLYRMIFAAITASFLLFGTIGLYLHHVQIERARLFREVTFLVAFFGCAFLLSNEWHQIFILPEIAMISPDAIDKLDASENVGRYTFGAMIALATFSFGWILFLISVLVSKNLKPLGPSLVIAGFFIIPLLSGVLTPAWGGIIGSIFLWIGFSLIGIELIRSYK